MSLYASFDAVNMKSTISVPAAFTSTVGIGTTAPGSKLSVAGGVGIGTSYQATASPTDGLIVAGNVGIGTTNPVSGLSVASNVSIGIPYLSISAPTNSLIVSGNIGIGATNPGSGLAVASNASIGFPYQSAAAPTNGLIVSGAVGIGTATPQAAFHIAGGNMFLQTAGTSVAPRYIAIASGGTTSAYSNDGVTGTWGSSTLPSSATWTAIACSSITNRTVAIASGGTVAAYSDDNGLSWFPTGPLPASVSWTAVAYSPVTNRFVAVATGTASAAYSVDGYTWVPTTMPSSATWSTITVSPVSGRFFAATSSGSAGAFSDNGGVTWTATTTPANFKAVACSPISGRFVGVEAGNKLYYSADGTTGSWTQVATGGATTQFSAIAVSPAGRFAVISSTTSGAGQAWYSTDGATWVATTTQPVNVAYSSLACSSSGRFLAIVSGSTAASYSVDGTAWVTTALPSAATWTSLAFTATSSILTSGLLGLGVATPVVQLDMSTDGARKLTTTTWLTGSDQRIKTDIMSADLDRCYEIVQSIELKYFKWNFPPESNVIVDDAHSLGFIAQDVLADFPHAVSVSDSYGYPDFLSLNIDQILKAMYGALQKTMSDKESLESQVATLGTRITTLESQP